MQIYKNQIVSEREHWKKVLERLIEIVVFLRNNNLALQGSLEKLCTTYNGNFLGLDVLLRKFYLIIGEQVRRVISYET